MKEDEHSRLKSCALRFLSRKMRTTFEIEEKLRLYCIRSKIPLVFFPPVIEELTKIGLLNDPKYAQAWILERRKNKYRGDFVIEHELSDKGITKDIIDSAFAIIKKDEEYSENDAALALLNKKFHLYRNLSQLEAKKKLTNLLLRRGFSFDDANRLVDSIIKKEYNSNSRNKT